MYFIARSFAVKKAYDVGMVQLAQDSDFGLKVVLELLGELLYIDRFDRDDGTRFLVMVVSSVCRTIRQFMTHRYP